MDHLATTETPLGCLPQTGPLPWGNVEEDFASRKGLKC